MADPAHAQWWRHGRTWFVGVDALPNDGAGALPGGPPLSGEAIGFIRDHLSFQGPWHRAQLSVCCPGYPQRDSNETEAQHNYRLKRDAAHVDGLHGEGPGKRRHFRERHQFILGIPLNETDEAAAPFVVWEGSHHIIGETFATVFAGLPPGQWGDVDVTDAYQKARARVFATRRRTLLHAKPGEAYVAHKYSVHGVSPWRPDAVAPDNMRAIAYFRPAH